MATNEENPTKVEDQNPEQENESSEVSDESLLSLDSLDDILAEADPEFSKSLNEIGPDDPAAVEIYDEGLELEYKLADEVKLWEQSTGKKKALLKVLPFLPRITYKFKMMRTTFRLQKAKFKANAIEFAKNGGPMILSWFKNQILKLKIGLGEALTSFKGFSLVKKLLFVGLLLVTVAALTLVYRISTKGLLPKSEGLFVTSLEEWSQGNYHYDPKLEVEAFYDSMRASQNILVLEKMIVNLRRSSSSGLNPMGAFEFYVEGAASEVVVEIKDREPEMRDLFQRTIEEMTFDQISSGEGKQLLSEKLRKEVNKVLTKGKVRRVFIKTAIVKP
ncbi:flagellar basal body-associated protein FliL [compost metagenome]